MERFVVDRLRESLQDRVTDGRGSGRTTRRGRPSTRRSSGGRRSSSASAPMTTSSPRSWRPRDLGLPIAVRGGGHSVAGHAMADGALVVDMRDRREVTVDPVTRIVRVAGGALWEDVDAAAWAHHLAVVGGTFGDTGVGGLDPRRRDRLAVGRRGLHLRQPDPGRGRHRRRREGRRRPRRRPGPPLGAARRRRQLRRRHLVRVPGHRSRADPGRLHRLPGQRGQAGPAPAGRARGDARRTPSS